MRKVLSCVARLNGAFGRKRIALCLAGSDAREVVDAGLHRVSTFGTLRGRPLAWVLDVLGLSDGTVRNYLSEAISKLGASNRVEAARIARTKGWL